MKKIAIIGCGISGMSTAYELTKLGFHVEVFEKENTIGGRMSTSNLNGKQVCLGGKNIGKKYKNFRNFCSELGVAIFEDFGLNSSNGEGDKAKTFDSEKLIKSIISFTKGLPFKDIRRMLPIVMAVKKNRDNAYFSGPYFKKFSKKKYMNETLGSYFSSEMQKRIIRPLIVRNNAAEPDEVPLANFGTNIAMVLDSYEQFAHGPTQLFEQFTEKIKLHTGKHIESLNVENNIVKGFVVKGGQSYNFDAVVLATPACASSHILLNTHPNLSSLLKKVRYYPVAVVVTKYEKPLFDSQKRAWTFPDTSVLSNAGCYGKNDLDIVRYTFSGKNSRQLLNKNPSIETLINIAEEEVKTHTKLPLSKKLGSTGIIMKTGLCAYTLKHHSLLNEIQVNLSQASNLFLAGDYFEGVSIEACYNSGMMAAKKIACTINKN